jgi:hypothetical protein
MATYNQTWQNRKKAQEASKASAKKKPVSKKTKKTEE